MDVTRDEPSIAAVVVNLNGVDYITEALQSLESQDYAPLVTIVVDNGSTDGSLSLIQEEFPSVVIIENGVNLGFGGANNVGIREAMRRGCGYVFLLNYDAVAEPTCVSTLVHAARETKVGMVGPKIMYYDHPELIWSAGGRVHFFRGSVEHRGIREEDRGQYDSRTDVDYLTACAVLLDMDMLREIGLFDDAFFPSYFEDTDLCRRALRGGYRLLYDPEAVVSHRVSAHSGGGTTALKVRLRVKNQLLFFRRYAAWYHWITIVPCAGASALVFALRWALRGRLSLIRALLVGMWSTVVCRKGSGCRVGY